MTPAELLAIQDRAERAVPSEIPAEDEDEGVCAICGEWVAWEDECPSDRQDRICNECLWSTFDALRLYDIPALLSHVKELAKDIDALLAAVEWYATATDAWWAGDAGNRARVALAAVQEKK